MVALGVRFLDRNDWVERPGGRLRHEKLTAALSPND